MLHRFGFAITNLGDLNSDGYEDIAVGAPYEGNGAIYIYLGSEQGLIPEPSQVCMPLEVCNVKDYEHVCSFHGSHILMTVQWVMLDFAFVTRSIKIELTCICNSRIIFRYFIFHIFSLSMTGVNSVQHGQCAEPDGPYQLGRFSNWMNCYQSNNLYLSNKPYQPGES